MMKKGLILLLCLALLIPAFAQAKTFRYTIPELIERQLNSGGTSLRVKVQATAEGASPALMDARVWEVMKNALADTQLTATYFKSKSGDTAGDQQVKTSLMKGENALSSLTLTGKQTQWYLESDLLPGKLYSITRDAAQAYMNLTAPEAGTWPDILRLFTAIDQADDDFKLQLESAMNEHMASLNRWLQSHTVVEIAPDANGGMKMLQEICVSAADMKAQTKAFLKELYDDAALLALLRTAVPTADAQAYLESGMLKVFNQAIDDMQLEGEVIITRAYAGDGTLTGEQITLPFGSGIPVQQIVITRGETMGVDIALKSGARYAVTAKGENGLYTGEISLKNAKEEKAFETLFTLAVSMGMEQYNEENASRERDQKHEFSLLLRPKAEKAFADQQITASVHLTAGASNTKPAYVDTQIIWCDLLNGGKLTLDVNLNTSSGLRHSGVDTASSVQTDTLKRAEREELLADLTQNLQSALEGLLSKLLAQ